MSRLASSPTIASVPAAVPGWAIPRTPGVDTAEAAFLAGAALNSLDHLVRAEHPWAGAWRQRLALTCAAAACRLAGRSEDEAALRDAWHLRKPDDDPGPAGNTLGAWRQLAARAPTLDVDRLAKVVEWLGLRWDEEFAEIPKALDALPHAGPAAPFEVVAMMRMLAETAPAAELLAWWLGDLVLARKLQWPRPVPLLMAQVFGPAFRAGGGRAKRIRPGDDAFAQALCLALAQGASDACRLASEISRQAERLQAVIPKLRAKGAGDAISRLLDDDAVPGTLVTKNLSRFATRRLFERLEAFEAVRELSGRPTFRLYGL
ncbi:DUF1403 family protein [Mesorhizobium sp. KR1-2]|uniref:DUF1403 family protein n=1 Tax=Mesorhizobium sp. KR1-2 TaxID=3156609 RepID=UPI0032B611DF